MHYVECLLSLPPAAVLLALSFLLSCESLSAVAALDLLAAVDRFQRGAATSTPLALAVHSDSSMQAGEGSQMHAERAEQRWKLAI